MCSETVFQPRHFQAAREMGRRNFRIKGTWDFRLKLESNPENRPFWAWLRIYFTTRRDYTQDRQTNWRQNQLRDMVIWIRRCFLKLNGVSNTVWWRLILFWYILFSHTTLSDIWMDQAFRPSHSKWDQNLQLTLLQWDIEHSLLFYIHGTDIGPPTLPTLLMYLLYQASFEGLGEKRIEMRGRSGNRERKGVS